MPSRPVRLRQSWATAAGHPLLSAHAARRRPALRLSEAVEPGLLSHSQLYGDLLHPSGVEYAIAIAVRAERREMVVAGLGRSERQFSERDRDVLDLVRLSSRLRFGRRRRASGSSARSPPARRRAPPWCCSTATARSSTRASTPSAGSAEHFGPAEHPGWLPEAVAAWLALPPLPPLVSVRDGRRLTVQLGARRSARTAARGGGRKLPSRTHSIASA